MMMSPYLKTKRQMDTSVQLYCLKEYVWAVGEEGYCDNNPTPAECRAAALNEFNENKTPIPQSCCNCHYGGKTKVVKVAIVSWNT